MSHLYTLGPKVTEGMIHMLGARGFWSIATTGGGNVGTRNKSDLNNLACTCRLIRYPFWALPNFSDRIPGPKWGKQTKGVGIWLFPIGGPFGGCPIFRALLFGVHIRAPDFGKLPYEPTVKTALQLR